MWEVLGTISGTPKQNQYISTDQNDEQRLKWDIVTLYVKKEENIKKIGKK